MCVCGVRCICECDILFFLFNLSINGAPVSLDPQHTAASKATRQTFNALCALQQKDVGQTTW